MITMYQLKYLLKRTILGTFIEGDKAVAQDSVIPKLTTTEINALTGTDLYEGLQVYDKTTKGQKIYNGTAWVDVGGGGGGASDLQAVTTAGNETDKGIHVTGMDVVDFSPTTPAFRMGRYPGFGTILQANGTGPGAYEAALFIADNFSIQAVNPTTKAISLQGNTTFGGATADGVPMTVGIGVGGVSAIFNGTITVSTATENGQAIPLGQGATLTGAEQLENKTMKESILNSPTLNARNGGDAIGDMWYRDTDGTIKRIPKGIDGQVLTMVSGVPAWADPV